MILMWVAPAVVNRADHPIGLPKEGSITPLAYSYTLAFSLLKADEDGML